MSSLFSRAYGSHKVCTNVLNRMSFSSRYYYSQTITVRLQIAVIVRRSEMIFPRSESYIDSKMWSLLDFDLHQEDDRLMANYLSQNFNIEVNAVDSLEKIKLPPMVPGTKCFLDFHELDELKYFERKPNSENQVCGFELPCSAYLCTLKEKNEKVLTF